MQIVKIGDANKYSKIHILVVNGYRHCDLFIMVWRSVNMKRFHLLIINGVVGIDPIGSFGNVTNKTERKKNACGLEQGGQRTAIRQKLTCSVAS